MRILIFEQRYTNTTEAGIARFHAFAKEWAKAGHEVTVIAGMVSYITGKKPREYKWKFFAREKDGSGITVLRVCDSMPGYRTFIGRLFSYFLFLAYAFLAGIFMEHRDVVLASSPPIFVGFLGYVVAKIKRARFVFEVRDPWPDVAVELGFLKNKALISMSQWLGRFLYKRADGIVVNSPGLKDWLAKEKSVPENKINIVDVPVDARLFEKAGNFSVRDERGWNNKTIVLYSGALAAVYDFDTVLDVAKTLASRPDILFVFVGDGRQRAKLEERAKREGIGNVLFLGAVPKLQVPNFIEAADICIAPLRKIRTLPYVYATKVFDYMMGARAVLLAMEGTTKKLVCEDAKSGICVPPEDTQSFRSALIRLIDNPKEREQFGKSGRDYVLKNFTVEKLSAKYLKAIT